MDFTIFDYVVISLIAIFGVFGFFKGFIGSVLSLARWIISFYVATTFSSIALPIAHQITENRIISNLASFIIVFVVLYIIISVINYGIKGLLRGASGGIMDMFLGACFGVFKILFIMTITFLYYTTMIGVMNIHYSEDSKKFVFQVLDKPRMYFVPSEFIKTSKTVPILIVSTKLLIKSMPLETAKKFDSSNNIQDTSDDEQTSPQLEDQNNLENKDNSKAKLFDQAKTILMDKIQKNPEFAEKLIKKYSDDTKQQDEPKAELFDKAKTMLMEEIQKDPKFAEKLIEKYIENH